MPTWKDLEQDQQLLQIVYPRAQLRDHLLARIRTVLINSAAAREAIASRSDLDRHCARMRETFLNSIGGLPEDEPIKRPICSGIIDGKTFKIEKLIYFSRPNTLVTAHLYLPNKTAGPFAAVLVLCGHNIDGKSYPPCQSLCQRLVNAGLAVLIQDPIGQGERLGYDTAASGLAPMLASVTEHDHVGNQCLPLGDGLARYFLHDALRGLALLRARPDIDPQRIGVTGFSGGGTQTAMVMLADPGIAAAAPGVYITDRESCLPTDLAQDAEQVWPRFLESGFDHADILLTLAPRPVHVLAATYDYFPIEGTRRSVDRANKVCRRLGWDRCIHLTEAKQLHSIPPELAQAATNFFSRELLRETASSSIEPRPFSEVTLRCLDAVGERALTHTRTVADENTCRLAAILARGRLSAPRSSGNFTEWLNAVALRNRTPVPPNLRILSSKQSFEEMRTESGIWWSQAEICNYGRLFAPIYASAALPVTVALWDGGTTCLRPHLTWIRKQCTAGRAILVLDPTASGAIAPLPTNAQVIDSPYGAMRCFCDTLFWLGDSLMAMRIYDALRAIDAIAEWPGLTTEGIEAYAHGHLGACLLAAAAIDRRYKRVESINIEKTRDWVSGRYYDEHLIRTRIIPGSLQIGDWDDLAGFRGA